MRVIVRVAAALIACAPAAGASQGTAVASVADVRAELVRLYEVNAEAYKRGDLAAVMRLRAPDFHALTAGDVGAAWGRVAHLESGSAEKPAPAGGRQARMTGTPRLIVVAKKAEIT